MSAQRRRRSLVVVAASVAALLGSSAAAPVAAAPGSAGTTSTNEARRVDRVPTPRLSFFDCSVIFGTEGAQCATVRLPLDYDVPNGPKTDVALLRIKAAQPARKIGTLFLNPGGPSGSGVEIAAAAPYFLPQRLLNRFDIVGVDPRGVGYGTPVRCWANAGDQAADLAGLSVAVPLRRSEKRAAVRSSRLFGRACSTTGRPLSGSMSTAQVARDMDVIRRAVGDDKLTYLGFSYGSYLGQVYANMFPGRVRAVTIDGVLDPLAWVGVGPTGTTVPQTARLRSGQGADRALREILRRCRAAGETYCHLAGRGDPRVIYERVIARAKRAPIEITVDGESFTVTYSDVVGILLSALYDPSGSAFVDEFLTVLDQAISARRGADRPDAAAVMRRGIAARDRLVAAATPQADPRRLRAFAGAFAFPYDNSPEAFQSVLCTDGRNPAHAAAWPWYAAVEDLRAPNFGPLWTWASSPCASATWTVRDEDSFRGPFTRRTAGPVLVVGNFWDPATNYRGALTASALLPHSRLLSSDSWGHTAFGTSECVTAAVTGFLLHRTLPARGTVCVGDVQPFTTPLDQQPRQQRVSGTRPPIVPFVPPNLS
jgi:pimeloyl-ACP methyl ester carboxylesterase